MTQKKEQAAAITSPDVRKEILAKIRAAYPPLFSDEGNLNKAELEALLKDFEVNDIAKFEFRWAGKMSSKKTAFTPSKARLQADLKRSVNFDDTQNVVIEGENLEVLKLLQKSYYGQVKCIYIDPPYNQNGDFVYADDYSEDKKAYWEQNGTLQDGVQVDTSNETAGRHHSNWANMIQARLLLAQRLLCEDGLIFISINDIEHSNLRKICDAIFGEENFVANYVWQSKKGGGGDNAHVVTDHEYVLCFAKNLEAGGVGKIEVEAEELDLNDEKGPYRRGRELNKWGASSRREDRPTMWFSIPGPAGADVYPIRNDGTEGRWRFGLKKMNKIVEQGNADFVQREDGTHVVYEKIRNTDSRFKPFRTWMKYLSQTTADGTKQVKELFGGKKVFDYPKPVELISHILNIGTTEADDIVLDFFAGAGTTGEAVMRFNNEHETNLRYVLVQFPEAVDPKKEAAKAGFKTISELTIERLRLAGKKLLPDEAGNDIGFKVFTLASSLIPENIFVPDPEKSKSENLEALNLHIAKSKQKLIADYNETDLLYEVMLKDGFDLNFKVELLPNFSKNKVLKVTDANNTAVVCLDAALKDETVKALESHKDLRFICLHRAVDTTKKWGLDKIFGDSLSLI